MPGLRIYQHESTQYIDSTPSMLEKHIPDDKSALTMEMHKSDVHRSIELEPAYLSENLDLTSPEKSSSEGDLQIEVLDIDQFGVLSNSVEFNDKNYSNSEDEHLNNDVNENISCSSIKNDESTSLTSKMIDISFARSQVRNYKCRYCGFSTKNSRKHLHHLRDVHEEKFAIHECDYCEYASKHIKNLERHCHIIHGIKTENDSESSRQLSKKVLSNLSKNAKLKKFGKLECDLCTFATTSKRVLSVHVACHNQPVKVESDGIDDINSKINSTESNGIRITEDKSDNTNINSTDSNGIRIAEDKSDSFYSDEKTLLMKHLSSRTQKKYKCPLCKQNFRYVSWILRHLQNNHRGDIQAETLAAAYALKKRKKRPNRPVSEIIKNIKISRKTPDQLIFPSPSKGSQIKLEKFSSLSAVSKLSVSNNRKEKSHINSNTVIKCNICHRKFKRIVELQEHMQKHSILSLDFSSASDFGVNSAKVSKCEDNIGKSQNTLIMSKTGKQSTLLRNVRSGSKVSNFKYQCPFCPFIIKSATRFHIHFIQHMKNLQFRCSDCDYHSSWKWTVVKHIWSKICNERNHFNASVLANNELVDLHNFKLYKKYRVNCNQHKSINYESNVPQVNANQENQTAYFQSVKSNILANDGINVTNFPNKTASFPSLSTLNVPTSPRETNYFYCKECNFRNVSKQIVINHLASHAGIKPFQCSVCDLKSSWKHVIVRHIRNVHTGHNDIIEKRINYFQEGFVLSRDSAFESSNKSYEHPEMLSNLFFNCHICPYKTRKEYHMNFHLKQHKYREGANFTCDKCPYFVKFAKSLIRHQNLHKDNVDNECVQESRNSLHVKSPKRYFRKKSLACTKCPAQFSQQDRFKRHLELHGKNYKFKCNECDYSVEGAVNLVKHRRLHEMKVKGETFDSRKPYACPICPAVFSLKVRYQRHLKLHNKNYSNQHSFSFQSNANLIKPKKFNYVKRKPEHFPTVSKSFTCPKCPTVFASQGRFSHHLELHGKNYRFTCSQCDYSVQNAVNIKQHEKIHVIKKNTEFMDNPIYSRNVNDADKAQEPVAVETIMNSNERKLFICDRCPYYSINKNAVQNHQRSHWLKQGFECPHCDYSSMQRGSLHSHLKLHLGGNKLHPPEAFMKFQSFKIYVQEENGETLVFDDEAMVNEKSKKCIIQDDNDGIEETVENIKDHLINFSELEEINRNDTKDSVPCSNSKSDTDPVVVLTDIFNPS